MQENPEGKQLTPSPYRPIASPTALLSNKMYFSREDFSMVAPQASVYSLLDARYFASGSAALRTSRPLPPQ